MCLEQNIKLTNRGARNSSIDLLKLFAITMVVCLHVSPSLLFQYPSIVGVSIIHGLRSLFMLGVTIFAFITGYYGAKWSSKFFYYYFVVLFYGIVFCFADILKNGFISPKHYIEFLLPISGNGCWYASSYLLLLLFHRFIPLENIERYPLVDKRMFVFFLVICYGIHFFLGVDGTTILMLLEIYIIGRYMRSKPNNIIERNAILIFAVSFILLVCSFVVVSYIDKSIGFNDKLIERFTNNRNPLLLVTSISLFYYAKQKTFQSMIISRLSSYTLAIYIIHSFAKHSVLNYNDLANDQYPIMSFILSVFFTIIICIMVETVRRKIMDSKLLGMINSEFC